MVTDLSWLVTAMDLLGIFVFGLSGGTLAVRRRLDVFGVLVLAAAAALAGGVARDLLIGAIPPAAVTDMRLIVVALAAGGAAFFLHEPIARLHRPVMMLDAVGLGLFAVAGCAKALAYGIHPFAAALLGMTTAVGGGVVRDLLVTETPTVLREEIYAMAALVGAAMVAAGAVLQWPPVPVAVVAAALTCLLRIVSALRGWRAPRAPGT
jgi:uncharacterized membrane protein YeiH